MNPAIPLDPVHGSAAHSAATLPRIWVARTALADAATGAQWDDLAADAAEPNVFAQRWFVAPGIAHLAPGGAQMLAVHADDRLIALLPVQVEHRYGRLPLRHTQNWLHPHCFLGAPLIRQGHEIGAWTAILQMLDGDRAAGALLHVAGLVEDSVCHRALVTAARLLGRPCDTVHRIERAMLASDLSPHAYYEATVRKKKRKELARLKNRLSALGGVEFRRYSSADDLPLWTQDFLTLERSGWKGAAGSALACTPQTDQFFRDLLTNADAAESLDMLRIDHDGAAIAMLINLIDPPGSFSFKTAFDESYARYSPGVLIQLENLNLLERSDIGWMDSCAVENHPMINSLWAQRRAIVRVSVPLAGVLRNAKFAAARGLERASAALRARRNATAHEGAET